MISYLKVWNSIHLPTITFCKVPNPHNTGLCGIHSNTASVAMDLSFNSLVR